MTGSLRSHPEAAEGMKYEAFLIAHLITVLTSMMSYLLQECRGIWIIST